MNRCSKNKRPLALMAAGVLDAASAFILRKHLESCHGCRQYWESMCALSERLNSAELPQAEPSHTFHARFVGRMNKDEKAPSILIWLAAAHRLWEGRRLVTTTIVAALAVATVIWVQNLRRATKPSLVPAVQTISEAPTQRVIPPTLASYRVAANVSLENLDAVLAREIAPKPSAVETSTFASLWSRSLED